MNFTRIYKRIKTFKKSKNLCSSQQNIFLNNHPTEDIEKLLETSTDIDIYNIK